MLPDDVARSSISRGVLVGTVNDNGFAHPSVPARAAWLRSQRRAAVDPARRTTRPVDLPAADSASLDAWPHRDDIDDARLFRDAIGARASAQGAPPARARNAAPGARADPVPARRSARARRVAHPRVRSGARSRSATRSTISRPGQPPHLLKRLRRGQFSVRAEIDLHEMTRDCGARGDPRVPRRLPPRTANCACASCTARACARRRRARC